jgi:hypothetical protein
MPSTNRDDDADLRVALQRMRRPGVLRAVTGQHAAAQGTPAVRVGPPQLLLEAITERLRTLDGEPSDP